MNKLLQGLTTILIISLILTPVFAKPIEKPDLVVRDISMRSDKGALFVDVLVKNQGKADVLNFLRVEIEVETPSGNKFRIVHVNICTPNCVVIEAGMSKTFSIGLFGFFPINNYEKGIYRINAVVDPRNSVDEVSEGNNRRFKAVNVR